MESTTSTNTIPATTVVAHSADVIYRENEDGTSVLMGLNDDDCFYHIDGIASEVWKMLNEKKTISEVLSKMTQDHPKYTAHLSKDIPDFIAQLVRMGLVKIHQ